MKKFFVIAVFCSLFNVFNQPSFAAETPIGDCAMASVKDAYKGANAVFVGKLIKFSEDADSKTFEFKVEKYWKGVKGKKIKIKVGKLMRFEPFIYQNNKSYLIYAYLDNSGILRVGKCTRGGEIQFMKEDLKSLGKGKIPR